MTDLRFHKISYSIVSLGKLIKTFTGMVYNNVANS